MFDYLSLLANKKSKKKFKVTWIFSKFSFLTFFALLIIANVSSFGQSFKIDSLKKEMEKLENQENFTYNHQYIDLLNRLGELYYHINPDSTLAFGKLALDYSEDANYLEGKADAYRNIGAYYNVQGDYERAMEFFNYGLPIAESTDYWLGLGNINNSIGLNFYEQGKLSEAVNYYLKALEIKENNLPETEKSSTLNNLGLVFTDLEDYNRALKYHHEALEIRKRGNDKMGMASTLGNIGLVLKHQGKLQEALESYQSSLQIGEELSNMQLISVSHFNIGDIQQERGLNKEALVHFQAALKIDRNLGDKVGMGYDYLGLGESYFNLGNLDKALTSTKEGLYISIESKIKRNISNSHLLLSKIFEEQGIPSSALYHFKLHKSFEDSILNIQSENKIREMAAKYEFDKKETELRQAQREQELEREQEMEKLIRFWMTILLLVILIAFFIAIRSIKSQRKARLLVTKQKNELEKLNKEILLQKEETEKVAKDLFEVNQTKDKLFGIVGHDLKSPINSLKGLMQYVVDENLSQEEFLLVSTQLRNEVEQVHFTLINLLQWAKSQMKGIMTETEKVSVNRIMEETLNLYKPVAEVKKIKINNNLLPQTNCMADREHVHLILRNLINNSLKFTNKNGEINIYSQLIDDNYWEISIEDNGVGMGPEILSNLFKPVIEERKRYGTAGEKGTGLGLQLTKDFILKNEGEINVQSELGKGSKVTFTLPKA
ncbi:MAG: tetratricopeptide repeat-containing sensor histidine kinase [Cyclobacteriaceae bacterium]